MSVDTIVDRVRPMVVDAIGTEDVVVRMRAETIDTTLRVNLTMRRAIEISGSAGPTILVGSRGANGDVQVAHARAARRAAHLPLFPAHTDSDRLSALESQVREMMASNETLVKSNETLVKSNETLVGDVDELKTRVSTIEEAFVDVYGALDALVSYSTSRGLLEYMYAAVRIAHHAERRPGVPYTDRSRWTQFLSNLAKTLRGDRAPPAGDHERKLAADIELVRPHLAELRGVSADVLDIVLNPTVFRSLSGAFHDVPIEHAGRHALASPLVPPVDVGARRNGADASAFLFASREEAGRILVDVYAALDRHEELARRDAGGSQVSPTIAKFRSACRWLESRLDVCVPGEREGEVLGPTEVAAMR